jgi:mRNA interferase MazF
LSVVDKADYILCQVTSNPYSDVNAIKLDDTDFIHGSLQVISFVRPTKLFTANDSLIIKTVGILAPKKFSKVIDSVVRTIKG